MVTDQPERQVAAEIIREKILELYDKEIPYSSEVVVEKFVEDNKITFVIENNRFFCVLLVL